MDDVSLLSKRGDLLALARKKVTDDGYIFKKGHSRSKVYGSSESETTPKRPKYDDEMREERLKVIEVIFREFWPLRKSVCLRQKVPGIISSVNN